MSRDEPLREEADEDLPATVTFISILGAIIAVGWIGMFVLLMRRW